MGVIAGGSGNQVNNNSRSAVLGGLDNISDSSTDAAIIAGTNNRIQSISSRSVLLGGQLNRIDASQDSGISYGGFNIIQGGGSGFSHIRNAIIAGDSNTITNSSGGVIVGGVANRINADRAVILGGSNLQISNDYGVALGTYNDPISGADPFLFMIGNGSIISRHNAFTVDSSGNVEAAGTITPAVLGPNLITAMYESHDGSRIPPGTRVEIVKGKLIPWKKSRYVVTEYPGLISLNDPPYWHRKFLLDGSGKPKRELQKVTKLRPVIRKVQRSIAIATETGSKVEEREFDEPATEVVDGKLQPLYEEIVTEELLPVLNPEFDPAKTYLRRSLRPEWHHVVLMEIPS